MAPDTTSEPVVALLALDDMNMFEFSVACEVFGVRRGEILRRPDVDHWYDLRVCAEHRGRPVRTTVGVDLHAPHGLDVLAAADMVIVPMCAKPPDAEAQPVRERRPRDTSPAVLEALQTAHANGARIVSYCSGAFALAEAGLLDGRRATTHWMYLNAFRSSFPRVDVVPDVLYVDDGAVMTSAGSAAAIDLSLQIVRDDHGADVADIVARRMVVPPHREGGQAQYTSQPDRPEGEAFAGILDWIVERLDEPLDVAAMADRAAMSPRTFARRFRQAAGMTPHQWLTAQRVNRARALLETTDLTVDAVAARSGLGSAANLRARFQDACGVSPTNYRRRFRRSEGAA